MSADVPPATGPATLPLADPGFVDALGADARAAGFTADGVLDRLGPSAHRALARGEFAPALRATRDADPLATLIRLFLLGTTEPAPAVRAALPSLPPEDAASLGLLTPGAGAGSGWAAALDLRPMAVDDAEYLVISDLDSDLRAGPVRRDHVLGVGAASVTLARAVPRDRVGRALDLGTGCGIQALQLATHADAVVATDTNPRALALAAATARINGQGWDLREGSMVDPVAHETFDLIVSNPPFVVGAGSVEFTYRDSGLAGDGSSRTLVRQLPAHLNPGGTAQLLANWVITDDCDWRSRVGGWLSGTSCDAWVVQREIADPAEYVGLWLKDAGETGTVAREHALAWLDYFAGEGVAGIGMGLITLRRNDSSAPDVVLDEIADAAPTGAEVSAFFDRRDFLRQRTDADLLAQRLVLADDAVLEQRALPGVDGWSTVLRVLRRPTGPGAVLQLDEWGQALLGGCTGAVPLAVQLEVLAAAHDLDESALAAAVLPAVRTAIARGLLRPAGRP